jgi:hypothetical protein
LRKTCGPDAPFQPARTRCVLKLVKDVKLLGRLRATGTREFLQLFYFFLTYGIANALILRRQKQFDERKKTVTVPNGILNFLSPGVVRRFVSDRLVSNGPPQVVANRRQDVAKGQHDC